MKYTIKKSIRHPVMTWVLLLGMLLLNNCNCLRQQPAADKAEKHLSPIFDETILSFGASGVGKSTLSNSIFQAVVFPPTPISITNMNIEEHIYQNKKYINAPLSFNTLRENKQLEKALKETKHCKIIFVVTCDGGKIYKNDLEGINTFCEAIQAPFEYGIILNKLTRSMKEKIEKTGFALYLDQHLVKLNKQPSSCLIIEKNVAMEDIENVYFPAESKSRKDLLSFIANLKANKVSPIRVR